MHKNKVVSSVYEGIAPFDWECIARVYELTKKSRGENSEGVREVDEYASLDRHRQRKRDKHTQSNRERRQHFVYRSIHINSLFHIN